MTTQPHMMARTSDPDTSHAAAQSVAIDVSALEALVLETIARFPDGCIADDIKAANPQYRRHTLNPRFAPLLRCGAIIDTGERRTAKSGKPQRVVKFVPAPERVPLLGKPKSKRKPLTDAAIWKIVNDNPPHRFELARAIEKAHGIE